MSQENQAPIDQPEAAPPGAAAMAPEPAPAPQADDDRDAERRTNFVLFAAMPSWMVSLVLHVIIILLLALWYLPAIPVFNTDLTIGRPDVTESEIATLDESVADVEVSLDAMTSEVSIQDAPEIQTDNPALVDEPIDTQAATMQVELATIGFEAESSDLMSEIGSFSGSGLEGRSASERARMIREAGGTEGSEQAVKRGLQWLQRHQNPDGSWNFFHLGGRCQCNGHGSMAEAKIGATAIALLPFLGAGNTHMSGNYKGVVHKGLYYLVNSQKSNGSLWEPGGHMYSHGLAAIVLSEAYAMTGDTSLQRPAQGSLNFIAYAQDPITRGWRYKPKDKSGGDTSVVGWQLMALKSGHMAKLNVNPNTVAGVKKFLNLVQANDGATYGYMAPAKKPATTAVGLLCRMYLGWDRENPALAEGVKRIAKSRPSKVNLYYNYYATQVMRHYGGEPWEKWNKEMRDYLVKTQSRKGHAEGSWLLGKDHTNHGGRVYCTALATMILEVYYRHMPIYGKKASEQEFEL